MKTTLLMPVAVLATFFLVGCGDATFSAAQDPITDSQPSQTEPSQDDAGPTDHSVQVETPDSGSNEQDAGQANQDDAGQTVQDAGAKDWQTCCSDCASAEIVCQREGNPATCGQTFSECLTTCGTAPEGQTCNP